MLSTAELDYDLPSELIATAAAEPRDAARLMVVRRSDPGYLVHSRVAELGRFLRSGDRLVLNDTRVLRARLVGRKPTGGHVEGLFLSEPATGVWTCMLGAGHLHVGTRVELLDSEDRPTAYALELIERVTSEPGAWNVRVIAAGSEKAGPEILESIGRTPLPPYILKARKRSAAEGDDSADRARYQTTFAASMPHTATRTGEHGSVAAPTAGLHFTVELLAALGVAGVHASRVTLHVGTGTFRTVETEFVEQHPMHSEWCSVACGAAAEIAGTRSSGGRVICVGTTATRTVESFAARAEGAAAPEGWFATDILITPGYRWRWTDGLFTNFHLPRSTLMAMVGAFLEPSGGIQRLRELYATAIRERYRFYSFGDAMLILP